MELADVFLVLFVIYCPIAGLSLTSAKHRANNFLLNIVLLFGIAIVAGTVFANFGFNLPSMVVTVFVGLIMTANRVLLAKRVEKTSGTS